MWPFSLYRKIRKLENLLEVFRECNTEQSDNFNELHQMYEERGRIIVNLRETIFDLHSNVLGSEVLLKANRDAFAEIANHGTNFPNGTVQRMARTAKAAIADIDNSVPSLAPKKPASSAAEEMVKAA